MYGKEGIRQMINLSIETDISLPLDPEILAEEVMNAVLSQESFPFPAEINLVITDGPGIQEVNAAFRGVDRPTDVLSFPSVDFPLPSDFSCITGNGTYFNPDTGLFMLGDILLNAERVLSQATEYGHSPKREYAFLVTHSILHLLGYDHMEDQERLQMEEKQRQILSLLKIERE